MKDFDSITELKFYEISRTDFVCLPACLCLCTDRLELCSH